MFIQDTYDFLRHFRLLFPFLLLGERLGNLGCRCSAVVRWAFVPPGTRHPVLLGNSKR